jgi:glucokinase
MTLDLVAIQAKPCAIGVDIGGTKIAAGVVMPDGKVLHAATVPTPKRQDHLVQCILGIVTDMQSRYPSVAAVGVGAAGMVDWPSGHIRWAPNNAYRNLPLRHLLADGSGLPVVVENDANATAWAEATVGAGAGLANVIVLTIGTGIGGGIILNGELQRGQSGIAGEIGHMIVNPEGGELCGCGLTGCLEAMASGTALGRAGQRVAAADPAGRLAELAGTAEKVTGETVYNAARDGDPAARHLFDQLGYWLGVGIASLVNVFDPQLIVLGGGLVTTGNLLLTPTRASYEHFVFARPYRELPDLVLARLGTDAGLVGGALLALHQYSVPRRPDRTQESVPDHLPGLRLAPPLTRPADDRRPARAAVQVVIERARRFAQTPRTRARA